MTEMDVFHDSAEEIDAESRRQFRAAVVVSCLILGACVVGWCLILWVVS